jgi:hypothetical protein
MDNLDNMDNDVLIRQFGVDWTVSKCFAVAGGLFLVGGGVLFAVLVKHTGAKSYRLSPQEVGQLLSETSRGRDDPPEGIPYAHLQGARGVGIKLSFTISSLRAAAKRADWLTFWGAPACFVSWFSGLWLVLLSILLAASAPLWLRISISAFMALMVAIVLFMPWAAIYTDIEKDTEATPSSRPPARG